MFYLYAHTNSGKKYINTAPVDKYDTAQLAANSMDVQRMCFSDEGMYFSIFDGEIDKEYITHTYDELQETVAK